MNNQAMHNMIGLGLPDYSFGTKNEVSIVGAGLGGCAIAHALAQRGYRCTLYDKNASLAAEASALPVAVVRPAVSGDAFLTSYIDQAFELCRSDIPAALFNQCGALELTDKPTSTGKQTVETVSADQASLIAGTTLHSTAVYNPHAGFVVPQLLCDYWISSPFIDFHPGTSIHDLKKTAHGWQLLASNGEVVGESPIVVLATAAHTTEFEQTSQLPLQQVTGQIDFFELQGEPLNCIVNSNGYLVPAQQGIWCGSTHHRITSNLQVHQHKTEIDSAKNRAMALAVSADLSLSEKPTASFYQTRTYTPDRLPVVGAVHDYDRYQENYADLKHGKRAESYPSACFHEGLYLASALGSRGATQALLTGQLLASLICGNSRSTSLLKKLHPARFQLRALKRDS